LQNSPLGPEEIAVLTDAYERTLRTLSLVDRNDPLTELIARKVIELLLSAACGKQSSFRNWPSKSLESSKAACWRGADLLAHLRKLRDGRGPSGRRPCAFGAAAPTDRTSSVGVAQGTARGGVEKRSRDLGTNWLAADCPTPGRT
jgi:hypothetical protein